jgi:hypothetical protein
MEQFCHSFRPAAIGADVDAGTAQRHLTVLRHCVPPDDEAVLVARCLRSGSREFHLMVVTRRRLVVTAESRVLRRLRLHLNADPRHLSDVLWTPEPALNAVQLSATAIDGVREHFWLRTRVPQRAAQLLRSVFWPALVAA